MARKATSQDVAELAGVSRSAVSLVLNGRAEGNIAADKQAAIRAAASKLNYTPNSVALSLRNQRTSTIGVVTDAIATTAFGGNLLQGATDVAMAAGYLLLVVDTHYDEERETAAYEVLRNRQVDGFLFAAMSQHRHTAPAFLRTVPAVLANSFEAENLITGVAADEEHGGYDAARILIDHGHRDIVMLAGTQDVDAAGLRIDGFRRAMKEAGLRAAKPIVVGWDIGKGYQAAMAVLQGKNRPTGVLCANDRLAVGVVIAAGQLGLSVPGDLSVVGYDDDENVAPLMIPPLTTIRLPHRAIGERAMQLLLDQLDLDRPSGKTPSPEQILLPCPVIERDSVARPRT